MQQNVDSDLDWDFVDSAEILLTQTNAEINNSISKKGQNP